MDLCKVGSPSSKSSRASLVVSPQESLRFLEKERQVVGAVAQLSCAFDDPLRPRGIAGAVDAESEEEPARGFERMPLDRSLEQLLRYLEICRAEGWSVLQGDCPPAEVSEKIWKEVRTMLSETASLQRA